MVKVKSEFEKALRNALNDFGLRPIDLETRGLVNTPQDDDEKIKALISGNSNN